MSNNKVITSFESIISSAQNLNANKGDSDVESENEEVSKVKIDIPRGKCKSGKFWKTPKTRAKTIIKTKGLQLSRENRKKMQEEMKMAKQLTRDALEKINKDKEEHRKRRAANLKKQEENKRKSEIVQIVKNPAKIKKKHLRMIEKRDTLPFLNKAVF